MSRKAVSSREQRLAECYEQGFAAIKHANLCEDQGKIAEARAVLMDGVEQFFEALRLEPQRSRQKVLRENLDQFLSRLFTDVGNSWNIV